jgi:hypothetical protein
MESWQTYAYGVLGAGGLAILGRWVVPILKSNLEAALGSSTSTRDTISLLQQERDHWKDIAQQERERADQLMEMKAQFELVKYQLEISNQRNADLISEVASLRTEVAALKERSK